MITYAVCLYRPEVFAYMAGPSLLRQQKLYCAEIVVVRHDSSIFAAYEEARQQASHPIVAYIHDDAALLDFDATPRIVEQVHATGAGVMGVVGARPSGEGVVRVPWWGSSDKTGGWARVNCNAWDEDLSKRRLVWQRASGDGFDVEEYDGSQRPEPCEVALLDGIFLVDRLDVPWPDREGWHGYDAARCLQARDAGMSVRVGEVAVAHHSQPDDGSLEGELDAACRWISEKWDVAYKEGP